MRTQKRRKTEKRCVLSYKRVGNHDVVLASRALEYVKKLGYNVLVFLVCVSAFITVVSAYTLDNDRLPMIRGEGDGITSDVNDIWVNEAGDTMSGGLNFTTASTGLSFFGGLNYFDMYASGSDFYLTSLLNGYFKPITNMYFQQKNPSVTAFVIDEAISGSSVDLFNVIAQGVSKFTIDKNGLVLAQNISVAKRLDAPNICYSDGTNCTSTGSGNSSFNQTLTDALYIPYENATKKINLNMKQVINASNFSVTQLAGANVPFRIVGYGSDGAAVDHTNGVGFFMTHNELGNRQFVYGSTSNIISSPSTSACVRYVFYDIGASYTPSLDAARCDGSAREWLALGTDSTGVTLGSGLAVGGSAPSKMSVVSQSGIKGYGLYDAIYPSATGERFSVNNSGFVTSTGGVNTSDVTAVRLFEAGKRVCLADGTNCPSSSSFNMSVLLYNYSTRNPSSLNIENTTYTGILPSSLLVKQGDYLDFELAGVFEGTIFDNTQIIRLYIGSTKLFEFSTPVESLADWSITGRLHYVNSTQQRARFLFNSDGNVPVSLVRYDEFNIDFSTSKVLNVTLSADDASAVSVNMMNVQRVIR